MAVDVLVDALRSVFRGVEVTKDPDEAFDAVLGPLGGCWLLCGTWLDDDREDRAVFRQLEILLSQDTEELASQLWRDPQRADLSSRLTDGLSGHE
ncbi:MAG TPA: hypothetical protein VIV12_31370 [Streptosporangiaceae bacterium]